MKIKETIERECCQNWDMQPFAEGNDLNIHPGWVFCKHCGRPHTYDANTDEDNPWIKQPWPWESNE